MRPEREQTSFLSAPEVTVEVKLDDAAARRALWLSTRRGLTGLPRQLPPHWLYDARGSLLFEEILRLPEYYPARRERQLLGTWSTQVAKLARAQTLVELGAGSGEKTEPLLGALRDLGTLQRYVPLDVSEAMLRQNLLQRARRLPGLHLHGVVGDFLHHLQTAADASEGRRLVVFLGSTLGNLLPHERAAFLASLSRSMRVGDALLLGTDLRKSKARLRAAYNDSAGVTAAFNLNALTHLNAALGANFDVSAFRHQAEWDEDHGWVEMRLVAQRAQRVRIPALELELSFEPQEPLRTEVSCKFTPEGLEDELDRASLQLNEWWTDDAGDYALSLSAVKARKD